MNWLGRARLGLGWAAFVGQTGDNRAHAHHALQIVIGFESPARIWSLAMSDTADMSQAGIIEAHATVVPSDLVHALLPGPNTVGLLYLERESVVARALELRLDSMHQNGQILVLPDVNLKTIRGAFDAALAGLAGGIETLLNALLDGVPYPTSAPASSPIGKVTDRLDDTITRVVDRLRHASELDVSAKALAAWAHLSSSRFAHRFKAHTGMPLRPYLRWLRLQNAAAAIVAGRTATEAAHAAGFADAAHLSRTLSRHFGITPSTLAGMTSIAKT